MLCVPAVGQMGSRDGKLQNFQNKDPRGRGKAGSAEPGPQGVGGGRAEVGRESRRGSSPALGQRLGEGAETALPLQRLLAFHYRREPERCSPARRGRRAAAGGAPAG